MPRAHRKSGVVSSFFFPWRAVRCPSASHQRPPCPARARQGTRPPGGAGQGAPAAVRGGPGSPGRAPGARPAPLRQAACPRSPGFLPPPPTLIARPFFCSSSSLSPGLAPRARLTRPTGSCPVSPGGGGGAGEGRGPRASPLSGSTALFFLCSLCPRRPLRQRPRPETDPMRLFHDPAPLTDTAAPSRRDETHAHTHDTLHQRSPIHTGEDSGAAAKGRRKKGGREETRAASLSALSPLPATPPPAPRPPLLFCFPFVHTPLAHPAPIPPQPSILSLSRSGFVPRGGEARGFFFLPCHARLCLGSLPPATSLLLGARARSVFFCFFLRFSSALAHLFTTASLPVYKRRVLFKPVGTRVCLFFCGAVCGGA